MVRLQRRNQGRYKNAENISFWSASHISLPPACKMTTPVIHLRDIQARPRIFTIWEEQRNKKEVHWLMEMFAEMVGLKIVGR